MRRKIGTIAAVAAAVNLLIYVVLHMTGRVFDADGYSTTEASVTFMLWFVFSLIAGSCFFKEIVRFIEKQTSDIYHAPGGINEQVICPRCRKPIDKLAPVCFHCGKKQH